MPTGKQIRDIALKVVTADKRRWMWRIAMVVVAFTFINIVAQTSIRTVFLATNASDVEMYIQRAYDARSKNEPVAPPDVRELLHMIGASSLLYMVSFIISGAAKSGVARVSLRAVRGEDAEWSRGIFAGFRDPLGMLSLSFITFLLVFAGLVLFIVPGIVVMYGLRQSWFLKAEHPDWPALKCISTSWNAMKGAKAALFWLDLIFLFYVLIGFSVFTLFSLLGPLVIVGLVFLLAFCVFINAHWNAACALFYDSLSRCAARGVFSPV